MIVAIPISDGPVRGFRLYDQHIDVIQTGNGTADVVVWVERAWRGRPRPVTPLVLIKSADEVNLPAICGPAAFGTRARG
jgi:hypothetical protein